jgi:enoyl-CoA hydratase/carnithine racemase
MPERVLVEVADHIATVTFNRADKHNALDGPQFEGILEAAAEVAATEGVRAVVMHGAGKSFCSGIDLGALASAQDSDEGNPLNDLLAREGRSNIPQRACTDWIDLPVPVIAAIHGNCLGGGMQIALGADIRFAAPDAKLSVRETNWGLVPDMGITSTLPRLVPVDVAKEIVYTARIFSGAEANELGLVTHVADDPLEAAYELAREIAGRSPDAIRSAKKLLDTSWQSNSPEKDLLLETELQVALIGSPNQMEAVMSGLKKEDPNFTDPSPAGAEEARSVGFA